MKSLPKRLVMIAMITAAILLIPLIAMQFSEEVNWTLGDFIEAGALLLGVGILLDFALRQIKKSRFRVFIILGILILFLLVWAELAVGLFGTPVAGN
ncbi:MAG: hypothetical protein AAFR66_22120 [Bacteroidota bacterium]